MTRRVFPAALLGALLAVAVPPPPLVAQGWLTQTYIVSARIEAEAETQAHPDKSSLNLVVPVDLPDAEVCVDTSASVMQERGRSRVRVIISRAGNGGENVAIRKLEFDWRQDDPPIDRSRCQPVDALLAGDLVEFRFRFFDMPPLRLLRRGKRITTLPVLEVTGWVRHDPFTG